MDTRIKGAIILAGILLLYAVFVVYIFDVAFSFDNEVKLESINATIRCDQLPQGYINLSQGARLEGVTLYNVTLYAQDDNYSMKSVYGRDFVMIVNGTRIR